MVSNQVVFDEIFCHIFLTFHPEYAEMVLLYSVSHSINIISIALDLLCLAILFKFLFATVLFVATGVGGYGWPISARKVRMDVSFW